MDLAAIIAALKAWVTAATGIDPVNLDDEPFDYVGDAWATIALESITPVGVDEVLYLDDGRSVIVGHRVLETLISISSFDQTTALTHMGSLRAKMRLPSLLAITEGAGLGLVEASETAEEDFDVDDREYASAEMLVRWNVGVRYVDTDASDFIESVEVSADFSDVDDTALPASIQITEEILS